MIELSLGNKNNVLTTAVVNDIIKKEECARTNYYFNSNQASENSRKKTMLYQYSKFKYNQIEYTHGFKILFYEWNDLKRKPKEFNDVEEFNAFINSCNLKVDPISAERLILGTYGLFAACKKDSNEVIIQYTYCALANAWVDASYPTKSTTPQTRPLTTTEKALLKDGIDFRFFENSDVTNEPIVFKSWKELKKFADKYNIIISQHNEKRLKILRMPQYGACVKGYSMLSVRSNIEKLQESISIGTVSRT